MQPELLEALRAQLCEIGLEPFQDQLLPRARLAFDLRLDGPSSGETGESRWGGAPDAPEGFEWPRHGSTSLFFYAQIRLADLIEDAENPFPRRGLLLFFAEVDGLSRVVLLGEEEALFPSPIPDDVYYVQAPQRLRLEARADLPQWATSDYYEAIEGMDDEAEAIYGDHFNATAGGSRDGFAGQLLGHATGIGCDPRESAFQEHDLPSGERFEGENPAHQAGAKRWHNLVRFDSISELDFLLGDEGFLNLLIHQDDLSRLDFSRVLAMMESS